MALKGKYFKVGDFLGGTFCGIEISKWIEMRGTEELQDSEKVDSSGCLLKAYKTDADSISSIAAAADGSMIFARKGMDERGNQRERDRERAQARAGNKSKQPRNDGLTPEQRRQRDAKALQEKTARKAEMAAGGNNAGGGGKNK
ncbi:unnamed protein product [Citrullus colocynthis]|uniref:Small EDRK-rich factor-like N-terminal domain-containing protein n=1 Tax=Citrullus colocynthis TaxID=252529 RepID=A0ABP0XSW7_9ROSI